MLLLLPGGPCYGKWRVFYDLERGAAAIQKLPSGYTGCSSLVSPLPFTPQAEVQRLEAAVQQARKEQAAALRSGSRDLELIAAASPQRTSSEAGRYGGPAYAPHPAAGAAYGQSQPPVGYAGSFSSYAAPEAFEWQATGRPAGSYAPSHISGAPPPSQQQHEQQAGFGSVRASYAGGPGSAHPAFLQRYSQPATSPTSMGAAQVHYAPSEAGSDACSSYGGFSAGAARGPASSPLPQAWQRAAQEGSAGTPVEALAGRLGSMGLHTPASSSSPFATEDTLQVGRVSLQTCKPLASCANGWHRVVLMHIHSGCLQLAGMACHMRCGSIVWTCLSPHLTPCLHHAEYAASDAGARGPAAAAEWRAQRAGGGERSHAQPHHRPHAAGGGTGRVYVGGWRGHAALQCT